MDHQVHSDVLALAAFYEAHWQDEKFKHAPGTLVCEVATTDGKLKDKLKAVEGEIDEIRDERATAAAERDQAKEAFANAEGADVSSDEFKAAQEAVRKVGDLDDRLADRQAAKIGILEALGQNDPEVTRAKRENADRLTDTPAARWDSAGLLADDQMRQTLAKMATSKGRFGTMQLGEVVDRDSFAADIEGTVNMRRGEFYGVIPQLFRPLQILDLLPSSTMDGDSLPYTKEFGDFDDGVGETDEGELKPESGVTYEDATAPARTIATWMKIRKQVLADVPALRGIIDARLRYMVLRRLEKQVLAGNGTEPNLEGILETDGIGSVEYDAGEIPADQVLAGLTTVLLSDAMADAIVLNPLDWKDALTKKATGGDEQYYSGGPFRATPQVMWGTPLIPSRAIPQGTALVGDFGIGAQLFIREGVNVLLSDSDGDDFRRNRVTLLGEMRAALAIWRPAAFCEVDLAAGS